MFSDTQLEQLKNDLDPNRIKSRQKGDINLSYLEGFDIIDTANKVFGYGNWSYTVSSINQVSSEQNQNQNHVICYKAVVQVLVYNDSHTLKVQREDVGFGTGISKTLADAHEGGAKEAVTDAIKRCLRSFGNQFGNSLYSKTKLQSNSQAQNYQHPVNNNQHHHQNQSLQNNSLNYTQLTTLGLSVMQQDQCLIVVGDNLFENKEVIKKHGFKWDGQNKIWWKPMDQGVA